jgi:hypothetical protein
METKDKLYIVDFGRARPYKDFTTGQVLMPRYLTRQVNPNFSSVWADGNRTDHPRGEIMSLGLMMIFFRADNVLSPWCGHRPGWGRTSQDLWNKSEWIRGVVMGHRSYMYAPFEDLIAYACHLDYDQIPGYEEFRQRLRTAAMHYYPEYRLNDLAFDWNLFLVEDTTGRLTLA